MARVARGDYSSSFVPHVALVVVLIEVPAAAMPAAAMPAVAMPGVVMPEVVTLLAAIQAALAPAAGTLALVSLCVPTMTPPWHGFLLAVKRVKSVPWLRWLREAGGGACEGAARSLEYSR